MDYTKLEGADLIHELNDDARKWAAAFCQYFPNANIDEEIMVAWFANAIERAWDFRTGHIHNAEHLQYLVDKGELPILDPDTLTSKGE